MDIKLTWLGCMVAGCMAVGTVRAAEAETAVPVVSVDADLPLYSAYVWRGQVLNDEPVFQPALNLTKGGFGFNAWGNCNLTDTDMGKPDFSEIDLTLSYGRKVEQVGYGFGLIEYLFPHQTLSEGDRIIAYPGTREVYIRLSLPDLAVVPTISVYRDIDEAKGTYASAGLSYSREFGKKLTFELTASLGIADKDYNAFYFGVDKTLLNDLTIGAALTCKLRDNLSITPGLSYARFPDADIRESAKDLYYDNSQLTCYLNLNYVF
jgi:hypothetical protein